jgi:hypothetical protein
MSNPRRAIARDYAIEHLGFRITEITDRIVARLVSPGWARVKIIVPHNNFRKPFASQLFYGLTAKGLDVYTGSNTRFLGGNYDVSVEPVSIMSVKGQTFDTIYVPPPETLSRNQEYEYSGMYLHIYAAEVGVKDFSHVVY